MVHTRALIAFALAGGAALPPRAQTLELAVMTFNVQQPSGTNWEGRRDKAAAIITQQAPDAVGTQEAVASQRDDLLARLPAYACYGVGRDGGQAGEGSYIFYKTSRFRVDSARSGNFWYSSTPAVPSRLGGSYNRLCTYARLVDKASGLAFTLFNSHFYLESESEYRLASARKLAAAAAAKASSGEAVVITGDFNSPEPDAVTRWLQHGTDNPLRLRDTYRDFDPTGPVTTGFGVKLDYVYVPDSSRYATVKAWVVTQPAGASDHMPTQSVLRIAYAATALAPRRAGARLATGAGIGKVFRCDGRRAPAFLRNRR